MEWIEEDNRVYLKNEKNEILAYVTFPQISENVVCIDHTVVDESLRGMKIGSSLLEKAVEVIKKRNQKITLKCSYAISWFDKNPKFKDLLI